MLGFVLLLLRSIGACGIDGILFGRSWIWDKWKQIWMYVVIGNLIDGNKLLVVCCDG